MTVDMFERRFIQELMKLEEFKILGHEDPVVMSAGFPSWRAIFSSQCLVGHSAGYRLPSYTPFINRVEEVYCRFHPQGKKYRRFFEGNLRPGMTYRIGIWYESGMAETYLYACLAEALEDNAKTGIVLYDPRVDWKFKADVIVLANGKALRINAYSGSTTERVDIEAKREKVERIRKRKTLQSSQWGNTEFEHLREFQINRTHDDCQEINGLKLYSINSINRLLKEIYNYCGVSDKFYIG